MRDKVNSILTETDGGLQIFQYYISDTFIIKKAFKSPLREDKKPSFSIYKDLNTGNYLFKDFAQSDVKGDAIKFVQLKYKDTFLEAIQRIERDVINTTSNEIVKPRENKQTLKRIDVNKEGWNENNQQYFLEYGIGVEVLKRFNVHPLRSYNLILSNDVKEFWSMNQSPIFYYGFPWGGKIYQPNSKYRFMYRGEMPNSYVFGFDQLPKKGQIVIITGGEKDVLSFSSFGYSAISLNSETAVPSINLIKDLKSRFESVIVCYDNDATGIDASKKLAEKHDLFRIEIPISGEKGDKDISDYVKNKGNINIIHALIDNTVNSKFENLLAELKPYTFDETRVMKKPIPVLSIENNHLLSEGNLMVVGGKVKTGKSALTYAMVAGAISSSPDIDTLGMKVAINRESKAVIHFDTEQSAYDWDQRIRSTLYRANLTHTPNFFNSYHILDFSYKNRIRVISQMIEYNHRKFGGVHFVVIDGGADLIKSVNDEESSNVAINMLHQLSVKFNCPIVVVLHLNPDGIKTRGHFGSQLDRKAESVIIVDNNDGICSINPKFCRNANHVEIPIVQYAWNEELRMHSFFDLKKGESRKQMKVNEYADAINTLFSNGKTSMEKKDFKKEISELLELKRSATYNAITFMFDNNLIQQNSEDENIIEIVNP